ncbi:MAG: YggS family pyridoxal phosphate-dependent enzyme [Planctomycetes bacterium]|nr:YggS family pyridoxal phosphate-dependent enzyme [Planctomycetota bacterium]
MIDPGEVISRNLTDVKRRMQAACERAGRSSASVSLVAVTKYAELDWVRAIVALGMQELGENRPQQLLQRADQITAPVQWHLIGPLQRNKVRALLPRVTLIHSVDSVRLLEAIERIAGELQLQPRVLLEVNLSQEEAKHGFSEAELRDAWTSIQTLQHTQVMGLMTMAAYSEQAEEARPVFSQLCRLKNELSQQMPAARADQFRHLSMGMTGDFEVAIEEGATLVRIGSALWQGLEAPSE